MQVHRRVAVGRDEPQHRPDRQSACRHAMQDAVLVPSGAVLEVWVADDRRGTRQQVDRLGAGVDNAAAGGVISGDHRRLHEEALREGGAAGGGREGLVLAIVTVHEEIRARLQLGVDASLELVREGAGASSGDARHVDRVAPQEGGGGGGARHRPLEDSPPPLLRRAHMLDPSVVAVQPSEPKPARRADCRRESEGRLGRRYAAAVLAGVHLDVGVDLHPSRLRRRGERLDLAAGVYKDTQPERGRRRQ
mmetsp:Transcript_34576/g.114539  ORF Transcript_34576/g.114539 Transcript_34576/m.114539 type:complete len:249 (-) Transcript_34576:421-1167(-)